MSKTKTNSGIYTILFIVIAACSSPAYAQSTNELKDSVSGMRYLDNGIIKLGIDLNLGGAITYLEDKRHPGNMINNHDWGRQIQMSFYGGPVPYSPEGKSPHPVWKNLGWNPIQSGDWANNRSRVLAYNNSGQELYVKCIPMQWPLDNVPGECTFESWIRLDDHTVQVKSRINNKRKDSTFYNSRSQELPAIYTSIAFNQLTTYRGSRPFTNDTVSYIRNNNPSNGTEIKWATWDATENWAANLNKEKRGLGIWMPESQFFCGGSYGNAGDTFSTKATATSYISPLLNEILDHNIQYEYNYVLILGSLDEIRSYVYAHAKRNKSPAYYFKEDRQHFIYENVTDAGWPVEGCLDMKPEKGSAIISPVSFWNAEDAPYVQLEAASSVKKGKGRIYFRVFGEQGYKESNSIAFEIAGDGKFHEYKIPLKDIPGYKGFITNIKMVLPFDDSGKDKRFQIRAILLK